MFRIRVGVRVAPRVFISIACFLRGLHPIIIVYAAATCYFEYMSGEISKTVVPALERTTDVELQIRLLEAQANLKSERGSLIFIFIESFRDK